MAWRLANSLDTFRDQVNDEWPNRSKKSDGTIGDTNHQNSTSDHNPWVGAPTDPTVTAIDITHDPENGPDCAKLVANLIASRDPRIKYVIWNRGIWRSYDKPGIPAWTRAPYTGTNPHDHHMHMSVGGDEPQNPRKALYDSTLPWRVKAPPKPPKFAFQLHDEGKMIRESLHFEAGDHELSRLQRFLATVDDAILRRVQANGEIMISRKKVTK